MRTIHFREGNLLYSSTYSNVTFMQKHPEQCLTQYLGTSLPSQVDIYNLPSQSLKYLLAGEEVEVLWKLPMSSRIFEEDMISKYSLLKHSFLWTPPSLVQFSPQSCLTHCESMDCSTPGFPCPSPAPPS